MRLLPDTDFKPRLDARARWREPQSMARGLSDLRARSIASSRALEAMAVTEKNHLGAEGKVKRLETKYVVHVVIIVYA